MEKKFAKLVYLENIEEIPVKYNVIKKKQDAMMDWYVQKYNPFKMEEINILSQKGYLIKLPLIKEEAFKDKEKTKSILCKTIESLKDCNVEIVLPPPKLHELMPDGIRIANGYNLFPFFAVKAVKRALRYADKNIGDCEFAIISGDGIHLTESLIDAMAGEINYLTIVMDNVPKDLQAKADDIFYETGLDIRFSNAGKRNVKTADIVINTSAEGNHFDYSFKRGSVYFDLSGNTKRLCELINNRSDIFIIDGLKISNKVIQSMPLDEFELGFYLKSSYYRFFIKKKYDIDTAQKIYEGIQSMKLSVTGLYQLGNLFSSNLFLKK